MSKPWNSDGWMDDFEWEDALDYLESSEIITSENKERLMLLNKIIGGILLSKNLIAKMKQSG